MRDPELGLVRPEQLLGVVGPIERSSLRVASRAGVVAPHDEMGGAVVLADDGVPHRLPRTGHPHGQGQQRQRGGARRVALEQRPVTPHAGVVIDVARLGQPHDGMDEEPGIGVARRPEGQLLVGPVHRVAGLEGDHPIPPRCRELRPQLGGREPQAAEVVMGRELDALHPSADAPRMGGQHLSHPRVFGAARAVDAGRLGPAVGSVQLVDVDHREHHALGIAQREPVSLGQRPGQLLGDVEGDGDRPQRAVGET